MTFHEPWIFIGRKKSTTKNIFFFDFFLYLCFSLCWGNHSVILLILYIIRMHAPADVKYYIYDEAVRIESHLLSILWSEFDYSLSHSMYAYNLMDPCDGHSILYHAHIFQNVMCRVSFRIPQHFRRAVAASIRMHWQTLVDSDEKSCWLKILALI